MSFSRFDVPVIVDCEQVLEALGKDNDFGGVPAEVAQSRSDRESFTAFLSLARNSIIATAARPGILATPDNQAGALLLSWVSERIAEASSRSLAEEAQDRFQNVASRFDPEDFWNWIRDGGWTWLKSQKDPTNRAEFLPFPETPNRLSNSARVAIIGDWGTGMYGAPECASSIESDPDGFDLVVHLGDVYYAGSAQEVQERFLKYWPNLDSRKTLSRACNSNHEMYSGGRPYFEKTLPVFNQSSSVFALENEYWLLVGLDTAYVDFQIQVPQVKWLESLLSRADGRRCVLFSHHNLFSHLSMQGDLIAKALKHVLESRAITAWYWGHEHVAAFYDEHRSWGLRARCVGHSGYPYFRFPSAGHTAQQVGDESMVRFEETHSLPGAWILDGPNQYVVDCPNDFGSNGYLVLELLGPRLVEHLVRPDGSVVWTNEL